MKVMTRMRDPNRLDRFYAELCRIHKTYFPDWRYGQFMVNFFNWLKGMEKIDPFFPEESEMLSLLKKSINEEENK